MCNENVDRWGFAEGQKVLQKELRVCLRHVVMHSDSLSFLTGRKEEKLEEEWDKTQSQSSPFPLKVTTYVRPRFHSAGT